MNKFFFYSEYGEILDLALHLQDIERCEVVMYIYRKDYQGVGQGLIPSCKDWYRYIGKGYIWVFDTCGFGDIQDWLRDQGELVVGGSKKADDMENNRQLNQQWFKDAGFRQPYSENFTDIDAAIKFVRKNKGKHWILKQNGMAPKSLNHMGKFPENIDMLFHLGQLKRMWNENQYGPFDIDLMEIVKGVEVAASVFFNGQNFLRNSQGKIVGYLNFEEKKEADGNTGETTGEMGTTFLNVTEDNILFNEIINRPKIIETLREMNFRGVFDINTIQTKEGLVALEPTLRFGIPSTSYELMEGLASPTKDLLFAIANGEDARVEINPGIGMVMCVVAKPFPIDPDTTQIDEEATSLGQRIWIMHDGKLALALSKEQKKHVHFFNVQLEEDEERGEHYLTTATKDGYILTVTGRGVTVPETRKDLIQYIKNNLYMYGMKYRTDIGERVEKEIKLFE